MILSCNTDITVMGKIARTSEKNGKTYFNLAVFDSRSGAGEIGCTSEVFNQVIEGKTYSAHFTINTAYLRKDYSCSINIDAVQGVGEDKINKK